MSPGGEPILDAVQRLEDFAERLEGTRRATFWPRTGGHAQKRVTIVLPDAQAVLLARALRRVAGLTGSALGGSSSSPPARPRRKR